ncbi:MAG: CvpA family protein [Acidiferrobacterales bacterium]
MNILDIIVAVIFFFYTSMGVRAGLVREILSLGKWLLAGGLSWVFADNVADLFRSSIDDATVRLVVGFITLFLVLFIGSTVAIYLLHNVLVARHWLKIPNYILGGVIGATKGIFIIMIAVLLIGLTPAPAKKWWTDSLFAPTLANLATAISRYLPRDVARHIRYN